MIKLIACVDRKMGIGKNNQLLTHLPKDLKHFKKTTEGHLVVFGRKTWESLPVKPLPNRKNAVLTSDLNFQFPNVLTLHYIKDVRLLGTHEIVFICGGETLYKQFLPYADELIISHMDADFDADTFFPVIDENEWIACDSEYVEDNINFEIKKYLRTNSLQ